MAINSSDLFLDLEHLGRQAKAWLEGKHFETKVQRLDQTVRVSGNWAGTKYVEAYGSLNSVFGMNLMKVDSALHVTMRHVESGTQVMVKQGSWSENLVINVVWTWATAGLLNAAFSKISENIIAELDGVVPEWLGGGLGPDGKPVAIATKVLLASGSESGSEVPSRFQVKTIECPHCGAPFSVTRDMIGAQGSCEVCRGTFNIKRR